MPISTPVSHLCWINYQIFLFITWRTCQICIRKITWHRMKHLCIVNWRFKIPCECLYRLFSKKTFLTINEQTFSVIHRRYPSRCRFLTCKSICPSVRLYTHPWSRVPHSRQTFYDYKPLTHNVYLQTIARPLYFPWIEMSLHVARCAGDLEKIKPY